MTEIEQHPYPEHQRMKCYRGESAILGRFLDWLQEEGFSIVRMPDQLADYDTHDYQTQHDFNKLLANYFEIDLKKVEAEKLAMLAKQRELIGG